MTAQSNVNDLADIAAKFDADIAVIGDPTLERSLRDALHSRGAKTQCARWPGRADWSRRRKRRSATRCWLPSSAPPGLEPTLAAAEAGKRLLLANKEAIVCAGALLMAAVERGGGMLLPVDSEHNAIHQCLAGSEQIRARRRAA